MQINLKASEQRKIRNLAEKDAWFKAFLIADYSGVDSLLNNNINTIADVKKLFKLILKILIYLYRKQNG